MKRGRGSECTRGSGKIEEGIQVGRGEVVYSFVALLDFAETRLILVDKSFNVLRVKPYKKLHAC